VEIQINPVGFILAGICFLGTVFVAFLGWLNSNEPFQARKFTYSCLRGLVPSIASALATKADILTTELILAALAAGPASDVVLKDVIGFVGKKVSNVP
jgi:hypothetical protein